jgi:hypothetical protein
VFCRLAVSTPTLLVASRQHAKSIPIVVYTAPPDDEQICAGNKQRLLIVPVTILVATNRHNTYAKYQLFVQYLLKMSR